VIRATLDVNVLVSAFPESAGAPSALIEWWLRRRYSLVPSEHILATLTEVWQRPYWRAQYEPEQIRQTIDLLRARALIVPPDRTIRGIAEDDEDDLVLATAVAGNVDVLVTGDKRLRALGHFRDINIVTPREFLTFLESRE
jgi:putative PIN family toxin of toxin-antitoxin system